MGKNNLFVTLFVCVVILLAVLIARYSHAGNGQTLVWTKPMPPEPKKNDKGEIIPEPIPPDPDGYRILYEIQKDANECKSENGKPRYALDVGKVYKYDLAQDPNFQAGVRYYFEVIAYSLKPIEDKDKNITGYKAEESTASVSACVTIKGLLDEPELEGIYDEEYLQQYYEEEKDEQINMGSVDMPVHGTGTSRDSSIHDPAQRTGYERSGAHVADHANKNILGSDRDGTRSSNRSRATTSAADYFSSRRSNHNDVDNKHVQPRLVSGKSVLLPSHSVERNGSGRDARVGQVSSRKQENAAETESSNKRNGAVITAAVILGLVMVALKI